VEQEQTQTVVQVVQEQSVLQMPSQELHQAVVVVEEEMLVLVVVDWERQVVQEKLL
jgi:hypothetical protein